jgi:putative copper export protein/mono/diheme cytochrome c family protein
MRQMVADDGPWSGEACAPVLRKYRMSTLMTVVALLRGMHVLALVSLSGTLVFLTLVAPSAMAEATTDAPQLRQRLLHLARSSTVCALIIAIAWLVVETVVIAGADSVAMILDALPTVAARTQFGQFLLLRCALLLLVLPLLTPRRVAIVIAAVLAAIALAVQPMLGHAGAIGGSVGTELIISEVMHLLAAGAWLGGLLPLFITVGTLPHNAAATACHSFTPVGLAAVLVLGGTAVVQVAEFMGGLPGLFGTGYGQVALVKLGLFAVLLALAAFNRLVLTDQLAGTAPDAARRHMRMSIATEAVLGTLVVITAAFLASHTPGTHEQPVWPFPWRLNPLVFREPDPRNAVVIALFAAGASAAIAIIGLIWRKVRWPSLALAVTIFVLAIPHLDRLFAAAYPTSFFVSPTGFAAAAIVRGERLYQTDCASCHGTTGQGDGPAAGTLPVAPTDLTAQRLLAYSDGDLFWLVGHAVGTPDDDRWDLIDYLRARNMGEFVSTAAWGLHPLRIPRFTGVCADGRAIDSDDLRGQVVRIVVSGGNEQGQPLVQVAKPVATITLAADAADRPGGAGCVAQREAREAFAILLGTPSDALAGTQFLVDPNGWLRARWRPGDAGGWSNPKRLSTRIEALAEHPLPTDPANGQTHHH